MLTLKRLKKHAGVAGSFAEADACQELARVFLAAGQLEDACRQIDRAKSMTPKGCWRARLGGLLASGVRSCPGQDGAQPRASVMTFPQARSVFQ